MATQSINLYPVADMYTDTGGGSISSPINSSTMLIGGNYSGGSWTRYRGHIKFNINQISKGKRITKANLHINKYSGSNQTVYLSRCSESFTDTNGYVSGYHNCSGTFYSKNGWNTSSILSILEQAYKEGKSEFAVMLTNVENPTTNNSNVLGFYTKESSNKPYLEVEYEDLPAKQPINLSPSNVNKMYNEEITFNWEYVPAFDGDIQAKFDLQYSLDNGQNWKTVSQTTNRTSYTLPANTAVYESNIPWKIRVYNKALLISPWEQSSFFMIGKPHKPNINNKDILNTPEFSVSWDALNQVSYRIKLFEGSEILLDTQEVVGSQKTHKVSVTLENNKQYTIKMNIKNQYGYWSDEETKTITTAYPEPAQPDINLIANNIRGAIVITCVKKDGILETHHFQVFRKDGVQEEYIKIADDVEDSYTDYTVMSGKTYYYKIRAVAQGGQYKESEEKSKKAYVRGSQLALTSNLINGINLRYNRTVEVKYQLNRYTTMFDGREKPVAEYGEHLSKYFNIGFLIRDNEDIRKIEKILTASETILYRDDRGRKIYGTVTQLNLNDDRKLKYNLTFTLQEVDFSEVV